MLEKKSFWKWILGGLALLLVLVVIAVYVLLSTYDFNRLKPRIEEAVLESTGRELSMQGDIEPDIGLRPSLVIQDVSLENASWGSQEPMINVQRFELQVALWPLLSGQVEVKRLVLVQPKILIETSQDGQVNFDFDQVESKGVDPKEPDQVQDKEDELKLPSLTVYDLQIQKASLVYRDLASGQSTNFSLNVLQAGMDSPQSRIELKLDGTFENFDFSAQGWLGPIDTFLQKDQTWPLELEMKALGLQASIKGQIEDVLAQKSLDIQLFARADKLEHLQELAGPDLKLQKPIQISARVTDIDDQVFKVSEIDCQLANSDLQGDLELNLSEAKPRLKADLQSKLLDLKSLLPNASQTRDKTSKPDTNDKHPEKVFSDKQINTDFLKSAQAEWDLNVGKMLLPGLAINDLQLAGALENGVLDIHNFQGRAGHGDLKANIVLKQSGTDQLLLNTQAQIQQMHLQQMIQDLGAGFDLHGKMDIDLDIAGSGSSVAEIMAGLKGNTGLALNQGRIHNKHISSLDGEFMDPLLNLLTPDLKQEDYADIHCCIALFEIEQGIAQIQAMVLDTDLINIQGWGHIDLGQEKLEISLEPNPKQSHLNQLTDKLGINLSDLSKPFKIAGTLAQPRIIMDPASTALSIGQKLGFEHFSQQGGSADFLLEGEVILDDACLQALQQPQDQKTKGLETEKQELLQRGQQELQKGVDKLQEGLQKFLGQ